MINPKNTVKILRKQKKKKNSYFIKRYLDLNLFLVNQIKNR